MPNHADGTIVEFLGSNAYQAPSAKHGDALCERLPLGL
jgi:hypothetical protein